MGTERTNPQIVSVRMRPDRSAAGGAAFQGFELAYGQIFVDQLAGQRQVVRTDGGAHIRRMVIVAAVLVVVQLHIQIDAIVGKPQGLCFRRRRGALWLVDKGEHRISQGLGVHAVDYGALPDSANHIAAKKNISLVREVSGSDCMVYGDYGRIRQLILILLDNAIKFSTENSTVDLNLCSTASTCVLTVSDSGPGVPEEELPYVFDRFYTSSGAVNPQGTGLFIANQIAQRHNADIRMENKAESGCRITVVFWKHRPGNNTM